MSVICEKAVKREREAVEKIAKAEVEVERLRKLAEQLEEERKALLNDKILERKHAEELRKRHEELAEQDIPAELNSIQTELDNLKY